MLSFGEDLMKGDQVEDFKKEDREAGKKCEQELQSVWVCKAVNFLFFLRRKRRCLSKTLPTSCHVYVTENHAGKSIAVIWSR